jgi:hypothetical protein
VLEITFKRTRSRETVKRYFLRYSVPDLDNTVVVGGLKSGSFTQWVLKDILRGKPARCGYTLRVTSHKTTSLPGVDIHSE